MRLWCDIMTLVCCSCEHMLHERPEGAYIDACVVEAMKGEISCSSNFTGW